MKNSILYLSILLSIIVLISTNFNFILSLYSFGFFTFALFAVTGFFRIEFPAKFQTVKDLICIAATLDEKIWNKEDVYKRIRKIIAEQFAIEEKMISPTSHLVNDLGMG